MKKIFAYLALCALVSGCVDDGSGGRPAPTESSTSNINSPNAQETTTGTIANYGTSQSPTGIARLNITESEGKLRFSLSNDQDSQLASIAVAPGTKWLAEWDSREQLWICLDSERLMILNPSPSDIGPAGPANAGAHGPLDLDWPYCPPQFKHLQPELND